MLQTSIGSHTKTNSKLAHAPRFISPLRLCAVSYVTALAPLSSVSQVIGRHLFLDLLGAPSAVRLAHICRRFDAGDEFQGCVCDSDEADERAGNDSEHAVVEEDAADENVDCEANGQ